MTRRIKFAVLWVCTLPLSFVGRAQSTIFNVKEIHWQEINSDGTKYAVLDGDRTKPGTFSYAFFMPDGVWYPAHTHSADAHVFVVFGRGNFC